MHQDEIIRRLVPAYHSMRSKNNAALAVILISLAAALLLQDAHLLSLLLLLLGMAVGFSFGFAAGRRWKCPQCGKRLPRLYQESKHLFQRDAHPYRCPHCGLDIPLGKIAEIARQDRA